MELHAPVPDETHLMYKEEETQSDNSTAKDLVLQVAEIGTGTGIDTSVKAVSVAELADELVNEETKGAELPDSLIASRETAEMVATKTAELAKEVPDNQPTVTLIPAGLDSGTGDVSVNPNLEKEEQEAEAATAANQTEQVNEEAKETESPNLSVAENPISGTREEDEGIELVKEIKEAEVSEAAPVAISDISPVTEITEDSKDAEPNHEEGSMATTLPHATPATETVNESAYLKPEAMLAEVKTEGPKLQDTLVTATTAVDNKDSELVNEEIKEFEFHGSLPAATPVVVTDLMPESKASEAFAVTWVQIENEKASEELEVERTNASPSLGECASAESEVTEVLPEKKKKRALGDHLAEEKANDSVNVIKSSSDEKKVELSQMEQIASAAALTAEVTTRDGNTTTTKTEADEKDKDQKAVDDAEREVTGTKVEVAQEKGEKVAEKESVAAGQEEVASKTTSRSSNNILSKVKHQIVKVKKAIVRRSPSTKNMPMENKDDIKVK